MREDVGELAHFRAHVKQVAFKNANVCQAEFANPLLSTLDRHASQVKTNELALRDSVGHGDEVGTLVAGDLKDAALLHWRGRQAMQSCHGGKAIGMCVWIGIAGIGDRVVRRLLVLHYQGSTCPNCNRTAPAAAVAGVQIEAAFRFAGIEAPRLRRPESPQVRRTCVPAWSPGTAP